jgi:hypothetical protein
MQRSASVEGYAKDPLSADLAAAMRVEIEA